MPVSDGGRLAPKLAYVPPVSQDPPAPVDEASVVQQIQHWRSTGLPVHIRIAEVIAAEWAANGNVFEKFLGGVIVDGLAEDIADSVRLFRKDMERPVPIVAVADSRRLVDGLEALAAFVRQAGLKVWTVDPNGGGMYLDREDAISACLGERRMSYAEYLHAVRGGRRG